MLKSSDMESAGTADPIGHDLAGRVALIVGRGAAHIWPVAATLARAGALVVVNLDCARGMRAFAHRLTDYPLLDAASVDLLVRDILGREGRIDFVCNDMSSAATRSSGATAGFDRNQGDDLIRAIRVARGVLPHMIACGAGRIINMCRHDSRAGTRDRQHFVERFTNRIHADYGHAQIRCEAIHWTGRQPSGAIGRMPHRLSIADTKHCDHIEKLCRAVNSLASEDSRALAGIAAHYAPNNYRLLA